MLSVSSQEDATKTKPRPVLRVSANDPYPSSLPVSSGPKQLKRAPREVLGHVHRRLSATNNTINDGSPGRVSSIPLRVSNLPSKPPQNPPQPPQHQHFAPRVQDQYASAQAMTTTPNTTNPRIGREAQSMREEPQGTPTFVNPKSRRKSAVYMTPHKHTSIPGPPTSAPQLQQSPASIKALRHNSQSSLSSLNTVASSTMSLSNANVVQIPVPESPKRKLPSPTAYRQPSITSASHYVNHQYHGPTPTSPAARRPLSFSRPRSTRNSISSPPPGFNIGGNGDDAQQIASPEAIPPVPPLPEQVMIGRFKQIRVTSNSSTISQRSVTTPKKETPVHPTIRLVNPEPYRALVQSNSDSDEDDDGDDDDVVVTMMKHKPKAETPSQSFMKPVKQAFSSHNPFRKSMNGLHPSKSSHSVVHPPQPPQPPQHQQQPPDRYKHRSIEESKRHPASPAPSTFMATAKLTKSHTHSELNLFNSPTPQQTLSPPRKYLPGKSPFRPLNLPSHIHPFAGSSQASTPSESKRFVSKEFERDVPTATDRPVKVTRVRSKSTAAKQWTLPVNHDVPVPQMPRTGQSSAAATRRILLSPFTKQLRRSSQTIPDKLKSATKPVTAATAPPTPATTASASAVPSLESPVELNQSPLHKTVTNSSSDDSEEDSSAREIREMLSKLTTQRAEDTATKKRLEEFSKSGSAKSAMTPAVATKNFRLNLYEKGEILDYRKIYFCGRPDAKKISGDIRRTGNNYGFDDSKGDYRVAAGDHIAYRYEVLSVLGKGSFGKVIKCIDHKTGKLAAVKMIVNRNRFHMQALIEADILKSLSQWDPKDKYHLVRYQEHFTFREHLCISTELLGINLYELIKLNGFRGLPLALTRHFAKQMLEALRFLEAKTIIHCDLKPENILISDPERGKIKIIDFGSSCYESEKVYTYIQSRFYRSPEVMLGMTYNQQIDMWSLGCIVAELITGRPLFMGDNEPEQIACIMEYLGMPDKMMLTRCTRRKVFFDSAGNPRPLGSKSKVRRQPNSRTLQQELKSKDPALIDFISGFLVWHPKRRRTPSQALHHPWLTGKAMTAADHLPAPHPLPSPNPNPQPPRPDLMAPATVRLAKSVSSHHYSTAYNNTPSRVPGGQKPPAVPEKRRNPLPISMGLPVVSSPSSSLSTSTFTASSTTTPTTTSMTPMLKHKPRLTNLNPPPAPTPAYRASARQMQQRLTPAGQRKDQPPPWK
ncbi:hypothetical protein TRVA0_003S01310 [Trichomonascus vanleenenianus]|uniref:DYRK family protein kinase n=1 Tax=Trichomonascus vanleenenianus TaxID=2268995 RepID=UPI003ECA0350